MDSVVFIILAYKLLYLSLTYMSGGIESSDKLTFQQTDGLSFNKEEQVTQI
jgi:hypothetical protein